MHEITGKLPYSLRRSRNCNPGIPAVIVNPEPNPGIGGVPIPGFWDNKNSLKS